MGSKKGLVEEELSKLIETEEQWAKISGDNCEHDFLHVVEIFSAWCGPSEAINSTLKRLLIEYKGRKIKFFKVRATCPASSRREDSAAAAARRSHATCPRDHPARRWMQS